MHVPKSAPKIAVCIAASFTGLAGAIIFLLAIKIISFEMGMLMLVASEQCISDSEF
jgi:hypothetical protein